MSYEFSSGIRLQVGQVIQDPSGSFEYVVEEVLESGANAFAARANRKKRGALGEEYSGKVFLKKYKSPGGASSWFEGFVDYQQEIRRRLQDHPVAREGIVEILRFFQRSLGSDKRRRAYYQLFSWEGQANNLRHYLKKESGISGQKEAAERFQIACDLLAILAAIHHSGVIHSDLKPENLMLNRSPRGFWKIKFIDFDFSLIRNKEAPWINPQRQEDRMGYLGTERYLSPEHLQGQKPSEASDIFTVGLILSELLIGKHPVGEDKEAYNRKVLGGQFGKVRLPDLIRSVVNDPDEVDKAMNRMLSFSGNNRPTASEVADFFESKRRLSIFPAENPELQIASEIDTELEKAGEKILKDLGKSSHVTTATDSSWHKTDIYSGRKKEDKNDYRKITLFLGLLFGVPLLFWIVFSDPKTSSNTTNNKAPRQSQQPNSLMSYPEKQQVSLPQLPPKPFEPNNAVEITTYLKVDFSLITYDLKGDVLSRTIRRSILDGDFLPGSNPLFTKASYFRLFTKHPERINLVWGVSQTAPGKYRDVFSARESLGTQGIDYSKNDPTQNRNLFFSGGTGFGGDPGYIASLERPGIGLKPFINDFMMTVDEESTSEAYRISVLLGENFIQNQWKNGPSGILQGRRFVLEPNSSHLLWGSHFVLTVKSIADSKIKVRFNENKDFVLVSDLPSEQRDIIDIREDASLE